MTSIQPPKLTKVQIWEEAEKFRNKYVLPPDTVPVPIEEIVEFGLDIQPQPIPNLMSHYDIDGFLSSDLTTLYIDQGIYENDRQENRRRFTYAHEAGHYWLHRDLYESLDFKTTAEWIEFHAEMPEDNLRWFEYQGHEFAGRLLVPRERLIQELNNQAAKVEKYRALIPNHDDDLLMQYIAGSICSVFRVSEKVIHKRIQREEIWSSLIFNR